MILFLIDLACNLYNTQHVLHITLGGDKLGVFKLIYLQAYLYLLSIFIIYIYRLGLLDDGKSVNQ